MLQRLADQLFVALQRLLPQRLAGRLVHRFARTRTSWLKNFAIRAFVWLYDVDTEELDRPVPDGYEHLNAFFTRQLRQGTRPVAADRDAVVSPVDGRLDSIDYADRHELIQAKRFRYQLAALLATDEATAETYHGGAALTVYLAPHNYHRVHLPLGARITAMVHVPGRRWAVNQRTVRTMPGLFAANERVVLWCESAAGPYALVMVGALNVATMSVPWEGEVVAPPGHGEPRRWTYAPDAVGMDFAAGDLVGQFNLGSTVIVLASRGLWAWDPAIPAGGEVRMGQRLGSLTRPA